MSKKILVLSGSSRKGGNTEQLADAFIKGAQSQGHEVKKISLYNKRIEPCMDCKYCYKNKGQCVLKDDMQAVYAALMEAQVLVIAAPVYFYGFPARLKAVWDRLHNPIRNEFSIETTYLLTAYADQGEDVCQPMIATYNAILHYLGWKNGGIVAVDQVEDKGAIAENSGLKEAEKMGRLLQ